LPLIWEYLPHFSRVLPISREIHSRSKKHIKSITYNYLRFNYVNTLDMTSHLHKPPQSVFCIWGSLLLAHRALANSHLNRHTDTIESDPPVMYLHQTHRLSGLPAQDHSIMSFIEPQAVVEDIFGKARVPSAAAANHATCRISGCFSIHCNSKRKFKINT